MSLFFKSKPYVENNEKIGVFEYTIVGNAEKNFQKFHTTTLVVSNH